MQITDSTTDPEALIEIGARLRAHRKQQQVTAAALAARAGLSELTVLKAEAGRNSTVATLLRLLRALGEYSQVDLIVRPPAPSPLDGLPPERGDG